MKRTDEPTPPLDVGRMDRDALISELHHRRTIIDAATEAQGRLLVALEGMVRAYSGYSTTTHEAAALAQAQEVIARYAEPAEPEMHPTNRDLATMEDAP